MDTQALNSLPDQLSASSVLSGVRNIIFDLGGVLFEIDYNAPVREFQKFGFSDFDALLSKTAQTEIFDQLETGKISNEDFFRHLRKLCPGTSDSQLENAWNSILIGVMPEQLKVVELLGKMSYRTFLLSNTNAIHVAAFEKMIDEEIGLPNFHSVFERAYYSNEIGLKKPYPDTFQKVCEWNGLVPSETLFIDDSIQHVRGAEEAGLKAIHLQDGQRLNMLFT